MITIQGQEDDTLKLRDIIFTDASDEPYPALRQSSILTSTLIDAAYCLDSNTSTYCESEVASPSIGENLTVSVTGILPPRYVYIYFHSTTYESTDGFPLLLSSMTTVYASASTCSCGFLSHTDIFRRMTST